MGWAIALHGGAGDIPFSLPPERRFPREEALRRCLSLGVAALKGNRPPLDVVELVVCELENCPYFNAGRGSVLTSSTTVEMEACIMEGNSKRCGAVSGLSTVVNPISLARLVMDKTPHIYLAFDGAETFAREQGVETRDANHFITSENIDRLTQAKASNKVQIDYTQPTAPEKPQIASSEQGDSQIGTVGCVAVDGHGNLAAANFHWWPGTYANPLCAISATGKGEAIIRATVGRDVAALMEYKGLSLHDAAQHVVANAPKGTTGLVAVSATGEVAMAFNTTGMFRACAKEDGDSQIAIWHSVENGTEAFP
ncbi:hypothetical protein HPP92_001842 [Vanilla planifolia]|uniref:beta-aspartyl-peptidase n=1 Tax=Vanilla planifolia TaxID=51239 RepID=A0A835RRU4_VANPL|nr:hypothetical protein HPP92_001842 [Vanilla planifolia]